MELYSILELDPNNRFNITSADMKRQYKFLAKRYHPDKYNAPDAKEKFIEIHMAYEVLVNDEEKQKYDQTLEYIHDDDWWDELCTKYKWTKVFFSSEDDFQHDMKNLYKLKWNEFKLSENIVRQLGEKIPLQISWKPDIILQVKVKNGYDFCIKRKIKYIRHLHILNGIILSFQHSNCELEFQLEPDKNYKEELITYEGLGNEIIKDGRIYSGDLHLDIDVEM